MTAPTLDAARETLRTRFGYPAFRAGQERAVASVLDGRDTMVILPTGGGKSLCYQVPALVLPGLTVVVSPLISLMKDQVDALVARGIPAAFVNSTLTSGEISSRLALAARGELKLLYLAPERFDAGNTAAQLLRAPGGISLLAIDEAHCISQWGHDFRPSYLRVRAIRAALGEPTTVALTATATPTVRRDIATQLGLRAPEVVITGFDRTNLRYAVVPARNDAEKDARLVGLLRKRDGLGIVYAATRRAVERLAQLLQREGIAAAAYHAGLDDAHRHDVQEQFMRETVRVIVATNAFGMGIDKPNVRVVVHHAMPGSLEAYYQEAGRAGRDGLPSEAILLHAFQDRFTHEFFAKGAYPERPLVAAVYALLERRRDRHGVVADGPAALAAALLVKATERDVESALRVLEQGGAVHRADAEAHRAHVRLLATPDRIRQELPGAGSLDRDLLRALWRVAGSALYDGAVVDLAALPSGLGTPPELYDRLELLERDQFVTVQRTGGGLVVPPAPGGLAAFAIDWGELDRRRRAELEKLNAVQRYAYTDACRRGFVLRYFGDPDARDRCEGCDNCLGTTVARPARAGTATRERRVRVRADPAGRDATSAAGRPDPAADLDAAARARFERLRALRSRIAREEQVPAYIVFDDRTLRQIAAHAPRTLDAMQALRGVGPRKIEQFGERVLATLADADG